MREWLGFLGNMRRAVGKGALLPGRASSAEAPGGSTHTRLRAPLSLRLSQEHRWFQVTEHDMPVAGLPRRLTLLHLTDIHIRQDTAELKEICRQLKEMRPDIVALTGDIVTRGWEEGAVRRLLDAVPAAPLGRFAIMGNWEYWADAVPPRWDALLAEHDVTLLREDVVDLGPLVLAGTDDQLAGHPDPACPPRPAARGPPRGGAHPLPGAAPGAAAPCCAARPRRALARRAGAHPRAGRGVGAPGHRPLCRRVVPGRRHPPLRQPGAGLVRRAGAAVLSARDGLDPTQPGMSWAWSQMTPAPARSAGSRMPSTR